MRTWHSVEVSILDVYKVLRERNPKQFPQFADLVKCETSNCECYTTPLADDTIKFTWVVNDV